MANDPEITFTDVERAAKQRDPQLASIVVRYLEQDDPEPGRPEVPPEEEVAPGAEVAEKPVPKETWTLPRLRQSVTSYGFFQKTPT